MTVDTSAIEDQFENTTSTAAVPTSNNNIRPFARDNQGTTRTRTRAGDVPASELKPNGKDTEPSKPAIPTNITHFSTINRFNGTRGPIGPRPGVYRPCARCRVKKTRCDRLKPSCSSCVKGGQDVICVYDNDEPAPGVARSLPPSMPQQQTETESQQAIKADPEERRRASLDESFSIPQKSGSSDSMVAVPKPTNDHNKRINNNGGSDNNGDTNNIPSNDKSEPTSQDAVTINRPADVEPPLKKLKTGSVSTEALKPSPLRSSITKVRIPTTKSSTSAATKESIDEPIDVVSVNDADDQIVSRLSVADTTKANESWNNNKENATTDTNETQTKSNTAGTTGRSRKQNKMNSANGASQSRIMVELSTAKPPSAFVIDKNKRARKWGRSPAAVQTLGGGELILSLWKSDQEMLLNEPRPYFVQRPAPMLSGLGSATATNLARIAVLNQWDNVSSNDTPERGNTPESREMSPTPAAPSSPQKKFKRGSQRQDDGSSTASTGTKRKRNRASSSRGMSAHVDEDMEDSSARSTPAPTSSSPSAGKNPGSRPRAIPTRPRTFPCSFEGCGKAFMDKFHLKRHETRHVTQVIVCGVDGCDKAYDSISTMRRHQSMMHKEWKAQQQLEKQKQKQIQRSKGNKSGDEDDDEDDDDDDDRDGGADDGDDDDNNNNDDDNDNDNEDEEEQQNAQLESFGSSPAPSSTAYTAVSSPIRDQM